MDLSEMGDVDLPCARPVKVLIAAFIIEQERNVKEAFSYERPS